VVSSLFQHAAGSALVKQGATKVAVATTIQIGQPGPESPELGDVFVTVEDNNNSHNDVLQARLQRILEETLPPELGLWIGKACIRLVFTVMILQDAGNVMDAALLGCMAAWKDTSLPTMNELQEVDGKLFWKQAPKSSVKKSSKDDSEAKMEVDEENKMEKKDIIRISLTMGVATIKNKTVFVVDPTKIEIKQLEGMITVVASLPSRTIQVEYTGSISLGATDLALAVKMANGRADELLRLL
jgi:exosome complex RNA-binding protein Rrp42 (RNase PH superfamily)